MKKEYDYQIVKSEINFLSFPFFCLAKSELRNTDSITYENTVQRGDEKVDIYWRVTGHIDLGIPGPFDKEVHRAIEALITKSGFPVLNPIPFTLNKLCRILEVHPGGPIKQRIKDSLIRMTMAGIESRQAFYTKAEKRWIEEYFHLYDHVIFKGKSRPDTHEIADTNYLFLSKWYLDNLNAYYIKVLDYDFYRDLNTPTDKRFYEILSLKFYGIFQAGVPFIRFRYSTLCKLFPLSRQLYRSLARQQLNPSFKRLKKKGFLRKIAWHNTNDKNDWLLYFYPGSKAHDLLNPQKLLEPTEIESLTDFGAEEGQMSFSFDDEAEKHSPNSQDKYYKYYKKDNNKEPKSENGSQLDQSVVALLDRLSEYKISDKLATQYAKQYTLAYLDEKIRIIEFKKSRDSKIKNSGGMLRKAIEENWQPPEDLTVATAKREQEIKKHKRLQAEEKQATIEEAKNKAVEEWISKSSGSLLAEIRKRAAREIKKENPETKNQFLRMLNKIRVKEIIAREYLNLADSEQALEHTGE